MQLAPVSVIIPTRNRPHDLRLTVRTLLEQTVMPSEVVIVDQSSDEESIHAAEQELQKVSLPMEMRGQRTNAEMASTASAGPDRGTTHGQTMTKNFEELEEKDLHSFDPSDA